MWIILGPRDPPLLGKIISFLLLDPISTLKNLSFLLHSLLSFKFLLIQLGFWLSSSHWFLVAVVAADLAYTAPNTIYYYSRIYEMHGKCMLPLHSLEETSPRHLYVSITYHLVERTQLNTQQLFPALGMWRENASSC